MDIALDHLTEAEQDAIYAVLRRDDQLRTKEHERIRQLQNDVKKIKLAGVIKAGIDANKTCARCRKEFGWIFDKGQICPNCQHKVCENCKATLKTGNWLCVLCQKQREIEAMSGQWFYKKFRKSKRNKKTNQVVSGNEIIRASIKKKPSPSRHGRFRNSADFEPRSSGKRAMSPSSLVLGSDGGGEDSDTQSTEMGPTSRQRRQDLAFPKNSDQARLQNLITGGTSPANQQGATRRVITLGGMGHDSSSSESEPSSPALPKSNKPVFSHDDSIQSSGRVSPASAISSEGHMTMVTERDISDIESLRSAVSGMEDFDSRRSADNARAAPTTAPPRRLAKTAEQEHLEALQEKSQEDLAGHSDSGDSDVASLTDLVRANQDDNDLEFTAVYELNSSLNDSGYHTKETGYKIIPVIASQVESSTVQSLPTAPSKSDDSLEESPTSVKDAVKTWESKKAKPKDKSYLGNEVDWSEVYEIDMVEEEYESDVTASDSGLPASLDVPSAEERTMKRAGDEVVSDESNAKVFKSSNSPSGAGKVNGLSYDSVVQDNHIPVKGDITPTISASSSDSVHTPSQSDTAAAQHEALQELRANIGVALKRLSDSPHKEEFQFEKSSHEKSSHSSDEEDYYNSKRNVSPEDNQTSLTAVYQGHVMTSMNRNSFDELADENEHVPVPATVKLREKMLRNANRNTLDYLAEENETDEMEEEKEIDLDDIIQENTYEMVTVSESVPSKVDTWTHAATLHTLADQKESDSEADEESDNDQNMTVVEAKEVAVSLPVTVNSFNWDTLNGQRSQEQAAEQDKVDSDGYDEVPTVTVTTEEIIHEETTVVKRQQSDTTDNLRGSRHRKMYVIDTDTKIIVPGLNSDEESDSHNEQSSSNRSSTNASGDSDNPVVAKVEDIDAQLTSGTDTANAPANDTANMSTATNSDANSQAPQPNFLQLVQSRFGFGSDSDTQKKSVSFNPYTEEYSDQGSDKSPDTSFLAEPVSEVTVAAVVSQSFVEKEIKSEEDDNDDSYTQPERRESVESSQSDSSSSPNGSSLDDLKDEAIVAAVSQDILEEKETDDLESYQAPERKESSQSESTDSEHSSEHDKIQDQKDQEGQFEPRAKSGSQTSTKSDFQGSTKSESQSSGEAVINPELHENSDTVSKTDSESSTDPQHQTEHQANQKRVLVRQEVYVDSDSDAHDLSKTDSRESEGLELSTDAATSFDVDYDSDDYEPVSLGTASRMPTYAAVNRAGADSVSTSSKNTEDEQRSRKESQVDGSKNSENMNELADSMAAGMVADAMRDAGWDESSDGLVRDAVPDSPVASVGDEPSANPDRVRGDSTLSEGDLSMSSSELTNPAPPTTSLSDSMAPEDRVESANEANGGVIPGIKIDEAPKDSSIERMSKTSAMSEDGSLVEPHFDDEDDDIDELFSSVALNRSVTNLSSTYSESRESIASYYSDAGEGSKYPVTGDIEFGAHYNYKTGIFEVHVKKCRDIAAVDAKRKRSDPYVKAYLLPDKNRAGKRKTKVKKHTLSPVFDEILRFSITKSELESRTLSLSVWHNDRFGRNDFLGEVAVPLDSSLIDSLKPTWHPLLDRVAPLSPSSVVTYQGDLLISLKFEQDDPQKPGSLHVQVKEARNLTPKDNGASDPFCKGYLLPDKSSKQSKQKTAVKKKTVNPKWDQTLTFTMVTLSDLSQRSLELTVWDHDRFNRNDFLGGVRLNLGTGKSEGQDVEWMDAKGEEISLWQSMLHRPNVWIDSNLMLRSSMDKRP